MFWKVFCLCFSLISLVGCGEKEKQSEGVKPLIVITSPDNPPFEFKDTAQGGDKVIGFDMNVVQELGQRLGRPVNIIEADFSTLIPALQAGRADMAIAAFTATDERRKSVDFSDPYHVDKKALLVLESSNITSEKDLNNKNIGVQLGSSHENVAHKWAQTTQGLSIIALGKIGELVQELKNGRVQVVLTDHTVAHKIAASTPGLKVVILEVDGEPIAIAFPKGSPLVAPVNETLKSMKEDIEQLEKKWFRE